MCNLWWLSAACGTLACVSQIEPTVTPSKIRFVAPAIQARALLLFAPSFEKYVLERPEGARTARVHLGKAATQGLGTLIRKSFVGTEIRHPAEEEVETFLTGAMDTTGFDIVLVPSFERIAVVDRTSRVESDLGIFVTADTSDDVREVYEMKVEVQLRVNARSLRTGCTFGWVTTGGTGWRVGYWTRPSMLALEEALRSLSYSLERSREEMEMRTPASCGT